MKVKSLFLLDSFFRLHAFFACIFIFRCYNSSMLTQHIGGQLMLNGRVCLSEAVRVVLVEEDAQWKAEFKAYGYDTDMWATYGEFDEEWREDVFTVEVFEDETFGFICGNETDRRVYGFTVDVYKAEEADGTYSFWITNEDYATIG